MKNIILLLDTDENPSAFDQIVALDSGAEAVLAYGSVTPENCFPLVEGAIYTRPPRFKQNTAIMISGSDLAQATAVFQAVQKQFFDKFRVSVLMDANGCNTTAASAVSILELTCVFKASQATVLAGTGPVGQRAAAMLAKEGMDVRITSRSLERAQATCAALKEQFDVTVTPMACTDEAQAAEAIAGSQIVLATGQSGVQVLAQKTWTESEALQAIADVGTCPPLGVEGVELADRGRETGKVRSFGGLAIGALKLRLQRQVVSQLFGDASIILDADQILSIARDM